MCRHTLTEIRSLLTGYVLLLNLAILPVWFLYIYNVVVNHSSTIAKAVELFKVLEYLVHKVFISKQFIKTAFVCSLSYALSTSRFVPKCRIFFISKTSSYFFSFLAVLGTMSPRHAYRCNFMHFNDTVLYLHGMKAAPYNILDLQFPVWFIYNTI